MKDPLDGGRTAEMFDPIDPTLGAGATVEDKDAKRREKDKLRQRNKRAAEKRTKEAIALGTKKEFWLKNRQALSAAELDDLQDQHRAVREFQTWMKDPAAEDFAEGLQALLDFVREKESPRLGYILHDQNIPRGWPSQKFWADAGLLKALSAENSATERYVLYGYLSGVPDWQVVEFLTTRAGWKWDDAAKVVGYVEDPRTNTIVYRTRDETKP
jgi:hypothetical protein